MEHGLHGLEGIYRMGNGAWEWGEKMERGLRGLEGFFKMGNGVWEWNTDWMDLRDGHGKMERGFGGFLMMEMEHGLDGFDGWARKNGTRIGWIRWMGTEKWNADLFVTDKLRGFEGFFMMGKVAISE